MNNLYRISIIAFIAVLSVSSCTSDVTLEPVSSISNKSFWKTESDATGVMYSMYDRLRVMAENFQLFYLGEGRGESIGAGLGSGPTHYWENLIDSNNGPTWQGVYTVIHHANLLIKYVPGISFTSANRQKLILAQAHAMRAYAYFILARTWGGVPLVVSPIDGYTPDEIQKERATVEEVFRFIKEDIETALKLYPDNSFPAGRNVWSKPAVNVLKGDVYLWTGKRINGGAQDFGVALQALEASESGDVTLLDDFSRVFDYDNKGNKEILMAIKFQQFESLENWGGISYMNPVLMSPNFEPATLNAIGALPTNLGGTFTVSNVARSQFTADDTRKNATFWEMYTLTNGVRSYFGSFGTKYNGMINAGIRLFLDDVVIYRYADVLLLKAEAKNALGQDPSADINKVRKRAYGNLFDQHVFVNGTKDQNDEAILRERLFELAFEGKRWWDLVRFGKAFDLVPSLKSRKGQDHLLLFPIPESTLSIETKVSQNPGYN
jgi:starch-binding outer membrane protein, SusD/RagB family